MTALATQLTNDIRTAAAVLINLNVSDKRLIPEGIPWMPDTPPDARPKHEPGIRLFKHQDIDMSDILQDLVAGNFVSVELKAIDRRHSFRVTGVLVRRDLLDTESERLVVIQQTKLEQMLDSNIWDITAYRNPGENGGNYSIEAGNPAPDMSSSDVLCIDENKALTVVRCRH